MASVQDRIGNLDSVRGLAVLGILVVNITVFAWPMSVFIQPDLAPFAVNGLWQGNDSLYLWIEQVFFRDRFRNLFTDDRERGKLLHRRLAWLAVFGLIHGLTLWYGDILLFYAWCGMFAMFARSLSGRLLVIIGAAVTVALGVIQAGAGLLMPYLPAEMLQAMASGKGTAGLTGEVGTAIANYKAGYGSVLIENFKSWILIQISSLTVLPFSSVPLMMLGMGLFKLGFFHGRMKARLYWGLIILSAVLLAVRGWAFAVELAAPSVEMPSYGVDMATSGASVLVALGYAALVIVAAPLFRWLAPVGRMAFTTYLSQSIIMATIFYLPLGPHLFGTLTPGKLWPLIGATWVGQIIFAHLWLRYFRWGPFEWLWRSLTQGRKLAIRKTLP
jgi:uncharacterized protein